MCFSSFQLPRPISHLKWTRHCLTHDASSIPVLGYCMVLLIGSYLESKHVTKFVLVWKRRFMWQVGFFLECVVSIWANLSAVSGWQCDGTSITTMGHQWFGGLQQTGMVVLPLDHIMLGSYTWLMSPHSIEPLAFDTGGNSEYIKEHGCFSIPLGSTRIGRAVLH